MMPVNAYLLRAWPRDPVTAALVPVRIAGGGAHAPYPYDYRSGLVSRPLFTNRLGFDENGWTGGTVPQTATLSIAPSDEALFDALADYFWADAAIEIDEGAEGSGVWQRLLTGVVSASSIRDGRLVLTVSDLSTKLAKRVTEARFAGTGALEGGEIAKDRVKRRSWGNVFNVEGRLHDTANSIYEFGDPAFPFVAWHALRDKGRAGALRQLPAGVDAAATYAALQAASAPPGGGVVAPSICMAKWWTEPAGPLTADFTASEGSDGTGRTLAVMAEIAAEFDGPAIDGFAAKVALRDDQPGVHAQGIETAAQLIDQLALTNGLMWILTPEGSIRIEEWAFDDSVEEVLQADFIAREAAFAPHWERTVHYQPAQRVHSESEVALALDGIVTTRYPLLPRRDVPEGSIHIDQTNKQYRFEGPVAMFGDAVITLGGAILLTSGYVAVQDQAIGEAAQTANWSNVQDDDGTLPENNADVTRALSVSPLLVTLRAKADGSLYLDQLPVTLVPRFTRAGALANADQAWSFTATPGITATQDASATNERGKVTITAVTASGSVRIAAAGLSETVSIELVRDSSAASGGAGGTGATSASIGSYPAITGSTYPSAPPATAILRADAAGHLRFSAYWTYAHGRVLAGKHVYRVAGSGAAWTDVAAESVGDPGEPPEYDPIDGYYASAIDGVLAFAHTLTSLTPSTDYEFGVMLRRWSSSGSAEPAGASIAEQPV